MLKTCTKCGLEKDTSDFSKDKYQKDGLRHWCKHCMKEYKDKNKNIIKVYYKDYRQANKEKIAHKKKKYNDANKERAKEYSKDYYKANKDNVNKRQKEYAKAHPEKYINLPIRTFCSFVIKPIILERDNFSCQLCKSKEKLTMHHILPVQHDSTADHITNPRNLVILCSKCHKIAHNGNFKSINTAIGMKLIDLIKAKEAIKKTVLPEYKEAS